ncbi:MAG TPA: stimulus-sensing domain-containing protein [Alphaproteobacteria bacterium]|nr:stimulus-sensing domain-containing protein [Alphaproteobacteria bacterium]
MAVDTRPEEQATALAESEAERRAVQGRSRRTAPALVRLWRRRTRRLGLLSPLTQRILLLNVAALIILVIGLAYLGAYQRSLISSQLESLTTQARIFAAALGESAVVGNGEDALELMPEQSRILLRRLIEPTKARARLFLSSGELIGDSRYLTLQGGPVQVEELPPPAAETPLGRFLDSTYHWLLNAVPGLGALPPYRELPVEHAGDYEEVTEALTGADAHAVYDNGEGGMLLAVAVPVQRYKRVVGALMVSQGSVEIDAAMRAVRLDILKAFAIALLLTTLFSVYLGSTIVRPIRRLAQAAERIGPGEGDAGELPDLAARGDEIGDLSQALRRMTELLSQRMDATARFAADVAHEIKNPLSSLRSAVETAARVKEPEQQRRLMAIIVEDVRRLDRLISDISDASRLDAELSHARAEPVDLGGLLATLVEVYYAAPAPGGARVRLAPLAGERLAVLGVEGRLAQVFRNLIENALSFSPPGGVVGLVLRATGDMVEAVVEDEGPGLPEGKLEAIFERFYSERPPGETFGTHSGLGLSISKQIVEAHGGTIRAENRHDRSGRVNGARFIVTLPRERKRGSAPRH